MEHLNLSYSSDDLPNVICYQQINFLEDKTVLKEILPANQINSYNSTKSEIYYIQFKNENTYTKYNIFNDRAGDRCISIFSLSILTRRTIRRIKLSEIFDKIEFAYIVLPNKVKSLINIIKEQYPDLHNEYTSFIDSSTNNDIIMKNNTVLVYKS